MLRLIVLMVLTLFMSLLPLSVEAGPGDRLRARQAKVDGQVVSDIAYGAGPRQKLDLYLPAKRGNAKPALVLFVHGGGWTRGNKVESAHAKPQGFTQTGYAFASVNYRLAPDASIADMQADLAAAVAQLRKVAGRYGVDGNRIILSGHSAGAHLAALLATDTRALKAAGVPLNAIKGVVLLDGAGYSLRVDAMMDRPTKMYETAFGKDRSLWPLFAPLTYVPTAERLPPFLILHVASRASSKAEAQMMAAALAKRNVRAEIHAAEGKTHGSLNSDLGKPDDVPTQAVLRFLLAVL
jgi:arylformamidase